MRRPAVDPLAERSEADRDLLSGPSGRGAVDRLDRSVGVAAETRGRRLDGFGDRLELGLPAAAEALTLGRVPTFAG